MTEKVEAEYKGGIHNYEAAIKDGKQQPYRHIGKYRVRADARKIVTGTATFLDDFTVPHMIYARILRSPYAHAKITRIDVEKAKAVPGVHCVLTYKELPKGWILGWPPHKLLLDQTVYFAGDPVAICAADTKDIADEALELVEVDYEKLPAVFDAVEALKPDAPVIFPGKFKSGTNEVDPGVPHFQPEGPWWRMENGDVEEGFKEAKWTAEGMFEFNKMPAPNAPEPPGAIVRWEGGEDYTIWATSQSPYICKLYNEPRIPHSSLHIKTFNVGGSYGNKQSLSVTILCCALAAQVTGLPVKNFMSKTEQLVAHEQRLGSKIKAKIGLNEDGIFCAIKGCWYVDTGALADAVQGQVGVGLGEAQIVMAKCKNWDLDSKVVATNKCPAGIVRGYGGQELNSALARLMSETMRQANMNPLEVFKKNYISKGDKFIWRDGLWWQSRSSMMYPEAMQKTADVFGWDKKWKGWLVPTSVNGRKAIGVGMGVIGNADVGEDNTEAFVRVVGDIKGRGGRVIVQCDLTESGMGQRAAGAKFAAEVLHVPIDKVYVTEPDSINNPTNFGLCGSRGTITTGKAVTRAALDAKHKIQALAAAYFGNISPDQIEIENFQAFIRDRPDKCVPIKKLGPKDLNIIGYGQHIEQFDMPSCCCCFVEVEVDLDTGLAKVTRFMNGTDIGQIIDNRMVRMQLQGGIGSACLDTATYEECIYDTEGTGRMLTSNMLEYKWRPFNEFPQHKSAILESQPDSFMFKGIGIGEISGAASASATLMAISNAIGAVVNEYPATPAVILKAIKDKAQKA
jgi:CO/xanthine dehydrogenase Mo-binding subunit